MNEIYLTPPLSMPAWYEVAARYPREHVEVLPPRKTPTRLLSNVERATVKVHVPDRWRVGNGLLFDLSARLHIMHFRGILDYMSGQSIADTLQLVYRSQHPSRFSYWGWDLLRALDASNLGFEVWLSAVSDGDDFYTRMRMSERLAQLTRSD